MSVAKRDQVNDIGTTPLHMKIMSKYWYPFLTRRLKAEDITFLNYGYEEDPPMGLELTASDEPDRYCIQLYHRTATQADISGKQVLEISCGHGGGASYLLRTLHPAAYTGLDFNAAGIAYCRKKHSQPELDFVHGDAASLPFPDQSFDAVINVEASHNYPWFPRFLAEVARVLRPGGDFLYADFRRREDLSAWEAALADAPMRQVAARTINAEVVRAMANNSQPRLEMVGHLPVFMRPFGRLFAGVPGSPIYRDIESGTISYRIYHLTKS